MNWHVVNTVTGEAVGVISDSPYALSGSLLARRYEQAKDEDGALLYLTGKMAGDGMEAKPETTTEASYVAIVPVMDGMTNTGETQEVTVQRQPHFVDAGPLYEWREVIPTPADIAAETQRALVAAVQNHLDAAARQYGYDDIKSAVTYAEEPAVPKFQAEGRAFRAWRSLTWAACYAILADVLAGTRTVPTADELLAELPAMEVQGG